MLHWKLLLRTLFYVRFISLTPPDNFLVKSVRKRDLSVEVRNVRGLKYVKEIWFKKCGNLASTNYALVFFFTECALGTAKFLLTIGMQLVYLI